MVFGNNSGLIPMSSVHFINVKVGKGQGMIANERINFPGTLDDALRIIRSFD